MAATLLLSSTALQCMQRFPLLVTALGRGSRQLLLSEAKAALVVLRLKWQ
jgi:hypothetical protein